jgi:ubiquinol-cytochrome c reductase cytochrome c subunit
VDRSLHDDLGDPLRFVWTLPIAVAVLYSGWLFAGDRAAVIAGGEDLVGADLFATQCASCHGPAGSGVDDRGPDIRDEGEAAVDFVLRTGRMPMADPGMQARRGSTRYTEAQIDSLVSYVGALGSGPPIPLVDPTRGDVVAGGDIYRLNCAACHVASGAGAAIGGGREAPSLMIASPTEIGEAIVVGPGAMPSFDSLDNGDINDVAAYIRGLQRGDADRVNSLGGAGPVAEGLAAWLLALLPLVALSRWIGSSHERPDPDVEPEQAVS